MNEDILLDSPKIEEIEKSNVTEVKAEPTRGVSTVPFQTVNINGYECVVVRTDENNDVYYPDMYCNACYKSFCITDLTVGGNFSAGLTDRHDSSEISGQVLLNSHVRYAELVDDNIYYGKFYHRCNGSGQDDNVYRYFIKAQYTSTPEPPPTPTPTPTPNDYSDILDKIDEVNDNVSDFKNEFISFSNDFNSLSNNQTIASVSENGILNTPLNEYSLTDGLLLFLSLGVLIGGIIAIIHRSVPRWR